MSQFEPRRQSHRIIHAIASLFIGILLALAMAITDAKGAEGTNAYTIDQITAAVCQVETGTVWRGSGSVSGRFGVGSSGEPGPWQITPEVIRQIGFSESRARHSVLYSERAFRTWYAHLYEVTGNHDAALAAYHRGLSGRSRKDAKAYAARGINLAGTL